MQRFNYKFQSQLLSIKRSLNKVFRNWLTSNELKLKQATQILLYFEKTTQPLFQAKILKKLSNETKALLKNIIVNNDDICAGDALIITAAQGFDVCLTNLAELHFRGVVFMEDISLWPSGCNDWTSEHFLQKLILVPKIKPEQFSVKSPKFELLTKSEKNCEIIDNNVLDPASELYSFLDFISRKEVKLTAQKKFTSRTQKIIMENLKQQEKDSLFNSKKLLSFLLKNKIVKVNSNGIVVPETKFSDFRKASSAEQLKLFLKFSFQSFEKGSDKSDFSPFFLKLLFSLLQENSNNNWLSFNEIISFIEKKVAHTFSIQKGYKGWCWKNNLQEIPSKKIIKNRVLKIIDLYFVSSSSIEFGKTSENHSCFRLTDFGKFWMQNCSMPKHNTPGYKLSVMPDFTALLTGTTPLDDVSKTLGLFGKRKGNYNATVFSFTRESIQSAVRYGHPISELFDCFKNNCSYPVPNNVKSLLLEWGNLSSKIELLCEVNLFSFETEAECEKYISRFSHKPKKIGKKFLLVQKSENVVLDIMKNINAFPIDYSLPPVKPLEIKFDGEVVCGAIYDIRLIALRNSISEFKDGKYSLSKKVMSKSNIPKIIYKKFLKLTSHKISLNAKINVLLGLGIIKETFDDEYLVIENLIPKEKRKLKEIVNLKKLLLSTVSKNTFIADKNLCEIIKENILETKAKLTLLKLQKLI